MMERKLKIGVMGAGRCDAATEALAESVGRCIAEQGAILICGGGRGIMEAASRGAAQAGGLVVGILPSDDEASANDYVNIPIVTGMGNARNAINVLTSHSLIAITGGPGTLSEIALAAKVGTPIVGLNTWTCSLDGVPGSELEIHHVSNAEEAVRQAINLARRRAAY